MHFPKSTISITEMLTNLITRPRPNVGRKRWKKNFYYLYCAISCDSFVIVFLRPQLYAVYLYTGVGYFANWIIIFIQFLPTTPSSSITHKPETEPLRNRYRNFQRKKIRRWNPPNVLKAKLSIVARYFCNTKENSPSVATSTVKCKIQRWPSNLRIIPTLVTRLIESSSFFHVKRFNELDRIFSPIHCQCLPNLPYRYATKVVHRRWQHFNTPPTI